MNLVRPDFNSFRKMAGQYNRIPVSATLICDELTPVSAFARLQQDSPRAFLLESVVGGEKIARYSFLGADPTLTFAATRAAVSITDHHTGNTRDISSDDPLGELEQLLRHYQVATLPGLPRFVGGALGYASYDTVRYYERLPNPPADDRNMPDLLFDIYETMLIFDHVHKTVLVVALATVEPDQDQTKSPSCLSASTRSDRQGD